MSKICHYFVYKYENGNYSISSMHTSKSDADEHAKNEITKICTEHSYKYRFNDIGEVQAHIASDDDKIVTARLVRFIP